MTPCPQCLFTVIHVNGIHTVDLAFCACSHVGKHGDRVQQLLRRRLLPATSKDPNTACTFQLLRAAHVLSVQSKLSLYDYYISLEQLTDASRTSGSKVCFSFAFVHVSFLTLLGSIPGVFKNDSQVEAPEIVETGWSCP